MNLVPPSPYNLLFVLLIWPENRNFAVHWKIFPPFNANEQIYVRKCNTYKNKWNWLTLLASVQSGQYCSDKRNQDIRRSKLTLWSTVLRDKLKSSSDRRDITGILWNPKCYYRVHQCSQPYLPWARLTQVTPFQSISSIPTLILFFHLHEGHKSSLFPNMHFYFLMRATCPSNSPAPRFDKPFSTGERCKS